MLRTSGEAFHRSCPQRVWFGRLLSPQPVSLHRRMHSPTLARHYRAKSWTVVSSANRLRQALSLLTCLTFCLPRFCTTFCNRNSTPSLKPWITRSAVHDVGGVWIKVGFPCYHMGKKVQQYPACARRCRLLPGCETHASPPLSLASSPSFDSFTNWISPLHLSRDTRLSFSFHGSGRPLLHCLVIPHRHAFELILLILCLSPYSAFLVVS